MRLSPGACALLIASGATLASGHAFAQGRPHGTPPPHGAPQTIAPSATSQQEALTSARAHFAAGVNLLRDPAKPRYEEAYREFKAAYNLSPAAQILGNLGLCAMMLERDSEAIEAYESYIKGMIDIAPSEREQLDRDLSTLKLGLARVTFTSNIPETTIVDKRIPTQGDSINNVYGPMVAFTPLPIGIRQGHHVITARAPGKPEIVWEVDATAGDLGVHPFEFPEDKATTKAQIDTTLAPPPPPDRPIPRSFWWGVGATAVLGVATIATGIAAVNTKSSYDNANRTGATPERADELHDRTQTLNVGTDLLLLGTIAAAAVSSYIFVTRPEKEKEPAVVSPAATAWLRGNGPLWSWKVKQ